MLKDIKLVTRFPINNATEGTYTIIDTCIENTIRGIYKLLFFMYLYNIFYILSIMFTY